MNEEARLYDVLGVKPGAQREELKAAYRDLAKVWHPDRFGHDPRLQAKAQEKLKQINEAYEELISGRSRRKPAATPRPDFKAQRTTVTQPRAAAPKTATRWSFVFVSLLVFGVGFFLTVRVLINRNQNQAQIIESQSTAPDSDTQQEKSSAVEKPANASSTKTSDKDPAETRTVDQPVVANETQPKPAMTTVTILIDSSSGLLARADCPLKSRMTFVSGNQPREYCTSPHAVPTPKESKIKSVAKRLGIQ